jgi:hypothetical protein
VLHYDPHVARERSPSVAIGMFAAAGLVVVMASLGLSRLVDRPAGLERLVVIPAGTAERLAAGEDVALLPDDLQFRLRDRLVVVNDDRSSRQVGPFVVAPGQRLEKRFSEAATLDGFCSLHATGRITIEITEP